MFARDHLRSTSDTLEMSDECACNLALLSKCKLSEFYYANYRGGVAFYVTSDYTFTQDF